MNIVPETESPSGERTREEWLALEAEDPARFMRETYMMLRRAFGQRPEIAIVPGTEAKS